MNERDTISISDADDPRIVPFRLRDRALAGRGEQSPAERPGLFVAEGDLVVERALDAGHRLYAALVDDRRRPAVVDRIPVGVPVYVASPALRERVTGLGVQLDVIALFHRPHDRLDAEALMRAASRLVVLDGVDNPTNLGAIARSASALGMGGILLDPSGADPLARRAARASMGAVFTLPIARLPALAGPGGGIERLHEAGLTTVALTPDPGALPIGELRFDADTRIALLLGSERAGLDDETLAASQVRVRIPMHQGIDSLNVAAAAAIACYALGGAGAAAVPPS